MRQRILCPCRGWHTILPRTDLLVTGNSLCYLVRFRQEKLQVLKQL